MLLLISAFFTFSIFSAKATEMNISLSNDETYFGSTLSISVFVRVEAESAEKPALEIHLNPKLQFSKASIVSTTCGPSTDQCTTENLTYKVEDGQLMGKFSLGDRIIKATRSFAVTTSKEPIWQQGYFHRSIMRLENLSATDPDENRHFAISVFRYWKKTVVAERSAGKYFLLHPANATLRISAENAIGSGYRVSPQQPIQVSLISDIDPTAGNVVLKLALPGQLTVEKSGYGFGYGQESSGTVMQLKNQTANSIELYVLVTPIMISSSAERRATLNATLKVRDNQESSEMRIFGSVLYGTIFRNRVDAPAAILNIVGSQNFLQREDAPKLPPRTIIEYAHHEPFMDAPKPPVLTLSAMLNGTQGAPLQYLTDIMDRKQNVSSMMSNVISAVQNEMPVLANFFNNTVSMISNVTGPLMTAFSTFTSNGTVSIADAAVSALNGSITIQNLIPRVSMVSLNGSASIVDTVLSIFNATESEEGPIRTIGAVSSNLVNNTMMNSTVIKNESMMTGFPNIPNTRATVAVNTTVMVGNANFSSGNGPTTIGTTVASKTDNDLFGYEIAAAAGPCRAGWWFMDIVLSDCYYFPKKPLSFSEASAECDRLGGHLPTFHSIYDFLALSIFWKNNIQATEIWIGMSRNTSQDVWKWMDESRIEYVDWCENYPTTGSKNCAICSVASEDNFCWKNRVCDQSLYFFCSESRWSF